MTDNDDLQGLAGEYVLGTLPLDERTAVAQRLANEPALREAIDAWEQRLLPLTALAPPQEPSSQLWPRISASLFTPEKVRQAGGWQAWWNNLAFWRILAGGGLTAALALAVTLTLQTQDTTGPGYLVVLVAPQDKAAGWIVQAGSRGGRDLSLIPLGSTSVPQQKALQFWTKGKDWGAPVSLGLVQPGQTVKMNLDKLPPLQAEQLFEITLEPATGSPTGRPTGPVLYIGRAVKVM
ncbi:MULTISPECIES: anti-sigma factor domain-containing protein [unclassified Janthinobacterium]|uniref:anti-sigma factor n=1 Tax=unclassified Janthinobacterium TaxID=2610881 RepID=UPI001611C361|nr:MULTISPECIES: anti-sigma factor [unclassified Janthinobacterium]MBB5370510.1 anti-sigma-K factor RskA [Janthinobacterium sp. K2C7]MBB5383276.1 anti-sigma-K factor RskA [Janthinobacterium sp. K2Li3]MBB5388730.1 anti-sigma-K factor RskA [Janthinobacterium sp. K2E3]